MAARQRLSATRGGQQATPSTPATGEVVQYTQGGRTMQRRSSGETTALDNALFIQPTAPVTDLTSYLWCDTSTNPPTFWVTV